MTYAVRFNAIYKSFKRPARQRDPVRRFLSFRPAEKNLVLSNFHLSVSHGEKVLITGRNGSGKTTLLKLASGLLLPDKGEVLVAGQRASRLSGRLFGLVLSSQFIHPQLTAYQNLEYSAHLLGCADVKKKIEEVSEFWDIRGSLDDYPSTFSRGMMMALALARATIHDPNYIFFDEPNVFLDAKKMERLREYLSRPNRTILVTAQKDSPFETVVDRKVDLESS